MTMRVVGPTGRVWDTNGLMAGGPERGLSGRGRLCAARASLISSKMLCGITIRLGSVISARWAATSSAVNCPVGLRQPRVTPICRRRYPPGERAEHGVGCGALLTGQVGDEGTCSTRNDCRNA